MSNVPVNKRRKSSIEFDRNYFRIFDDATFLISIDFGADKDMKKVFETDIKVMGEKVKSIVLDIGTNIRIAYSIFPVNRYEYEMRRGYQNTAIGLCYDLIVKYQLMMKILRVRDDKYVEEIEHIIYEIECLKNWRTSDRTRYRRLFRVNTDISSAVYACHANNNGNANNNSASNANGAVGTIGSVSAESV